MRTKPQVPREGSFTTSLEGILTSGQGRHGRAGRRASQANFSWVGGSRTYARDAVPVYSGDVQRQIRPKSMKKRRKSASESQLRSRPGQCPPQPRVRADCAHPWRSSRCRFLAWSTLEGGATHRILLIIVDLEKNQEKIDVVSAGLTYFQQPKSFPRTLPSPPTSLSIMGQPDSSTMRSRFFHFRP